MNKAQFENLINEAGKTKYEVDALNKVLTNAKNQIKAELNSNETTDAKTDEYKVKLVKQKRQTFNDDKAIELLKGTSIENLVVKTKLYVDSDALEDLIYQGKVDKELIAKLNDCVTTKIVDTLNITKVKGGKK